MSPRESWGARLLAVTTASVDVIELFRGGFNAVPVVSGEGGGRR